MLGFSPSNHFAYDTLLRPKLYTVNELLEYNLVKLNVDLNRIVDYSGSQRLIIPFIKDGKIIGLCCRTILKGVEPKYIYVKYGSMGLFNIDILHYEPDTLYLCEGAFDSIVLNDLGFAAIGIPGIHVFGKEQCQWLLPHKGKIILLFDNDSNESGTKGRQYVGNLLWQMGKREIYFKTLPKNKDDKKMDVNDFVLREGFYTAQLKLDKLPLEEFVYVPPEKKQSKYTVKANLEKFDMISIISKYIDLRQESPTRFRAKCPFHIDSDPSLVVDVDKHTWHCYGCGLGHNVLDFVRLIGGKLV